MFGLSKLIPGRLLALRAYPAVINVRNKGTIDIWRITPPPEETNETMGPYPRTKEERERAAKKYNLIPEDYEPYPEDEGWGDYPKLPAIGAYNRDKYDDFDDLNTFRDYSEPYHRDADLYVWHKIDPLVHKKPGWRPRWQQFGIFMSAWFLIPIIIVILEHYKLNFNLPHKIAEFEDKPRYSFPHSPNDEVHDHTHRHHHHRV